MSVTINRSKLTLSNSSLTLESQSNTQAKVAGLEIDASIDTSHRGFTLSPAINRELESGRLDRQIDINQTQGIRDQLGLGKQQGMFEDPLSRDTSNLGGLQLRDRISGVGDIEGLAGQHSAENYLGGAWSADRNNPYEDEGDHFVLEDTTYSRNEHGETVTRMSFRNKNDSNHTRTIDTHTRRSDGARVEVLNEQDSDVKGKGDKEEYVETEVHTVTVTEKNGKETTTQTTDQRRADKDGVLHVKETIVEVDGKTVQYDLKPTEYTNEEIEAKKNEMLKSGKKKAQQVVNPMDGNDARPMTAKDDPLGIIRDRDSLHERLRIINPEIDPMNEGDQSGYSDYINPALMALGTSNGGRSTGAWEEVGGAYFGPNIDALNDSLGGTSTGTDWL